jgi:hypothetical protein
MDCWRFYELTKCSDAGADGAIFLAFVGERENIAAARFSARAWMLRPADLALEKAWTS